MNEPRRYRSARWPTAERHAGEEGGKHMTGALIGWRDFTAPPVVCVANDNYREEDEPERGPVHFDNLIDTDTADRTVALQAAGEPWRPEEERFTRPRRNDPAKSTPAGMFTMNGDAFYQQEANAEDEVIRKVDESKARLRLGHVCSRLLDLACGDARRKEIATAVKQPDSPRIDTFVDHAIINWMRDPAFQDYGRRAA